MKRRDDKSRERGTARRNVRGEKRKEGNANRRVGHENASQTHSYTPHTIFLP